MLMKSTLPSYATLCDHGTFLGYAGDHEVYKLGSRCFSVVEEFSCAGGSHFSVYRWQGKDTDLDAVLRMTRSASAA
jgi:hypothetical protein